MNITMEAGKKVTIEIKWQYLHVIYGLLSFIKQFVGSDNLQFHRIHNYVESELRKKIIREKEAERYHLCSKCFKEIDTQKDKFKHTQFESGYEVYQHQECPATNQGKGYEQ